MGRFPVAVPEDANHSITIYSPPIGIGNRNDLGAVGGTLRVDALIALIAVGNETVGLSSASSFSSILFVGEAGTDDFYGVRALPDPTVWTFAVFG
jgi:hypothetical protein